MHRPRGRHREASEVGEVNLETSWLGLLAAGYGSAWEQAVCHPRSGRRGAVHRSGETTEVRTYGTVVLFKLYIVNGEEVFFGFYPVSEHPVTVNGDLVPIFDVMGKDATLFHFATDDDDTSMATQYVEQSQAWFESVWNTIGRERT